MGYYRGLNEYQYMENQLAKNMEHEMDIRLLQGFTGLILDKYQYPPCDNSVRNIGRQYGQLFRPLQQAVSPNP